MSDTLRIAAVDFSDPAQAEAFMALLDHYAADPMGGGQQLAAEVRTALARALQALPQYHGAMAWLGERPVGLINCFTGFSTFAARPLLNIHDIVVLRDLRQGGIGQALLAWAEGRARDLGCCKLTLEVLSNNRRALTSYERAGFAPYVLDPAAGQALFLQKLL